jgi:L-asparaginase
MRIKMLTTGGTIAMKIDPESGEAKPALSGKDLVNAISGIDALGEIDVEDIANIPSDYMGPHLWKAMAIRLNQILLEEDVHGAVITHGTDTLEETAYFMDLTVESLKPIVFTGAQRSASEQDSDGPRNLRNAVRIVTEKAAVGMGVMICLNGQICAARDATKTHTFAVETFNSGLKGFLGEVVGDQVKFYRKTLHRRTFPVERIDDRVDLIPMYTGADGKYIDLAVESGVSAIVIQAFGLGNVNDLFYRAIAHALAKGVIIVISTRVPHGHVFPAYDFEGSGSSLRDLGTIFAGDLSPWKARILLMLALGVTRDIEELQSIFNSV